MDDSTPTSSAASSALVGPSQPDPFMARNPAGGAATPLQVAVRRKWQILAFAVVMTTLVGLFVRQLPVRYSATASMVIDLRQPRVSSGETLLPSQTVDLDLLRTYMEGLRSPVLAREVVQMLHLNTNPEYCASGRRSGIPVLSHQSCFVSVSHAATQLAKAVFASNDGRSYVITINAEAGSPDLAATIANTYSTAYIGRQQRERAGLNNQADVWLSAHVKELRTTVVAADAAVEQQRRGEQLTNLRGDTLLTQTLQETNSQLTLATADLAQKQSMLNSLEQLADSGLTSMDETSPVMASPIIQMLTEREAVLDTERAELDQQYGAANLKLRAVDAERSRVHGQIRREVGKTVNALRGDVVALQARRRSLLATVKDLQVRAEAQGVAQNRLQDLVSEAAAARRRYEEGALRLEQIQIDSAVQHADVQVVVEASPPAMPSFPRTRMILTGTFMAMLGLGGALAYATTLLSNLFQDPEQVEQQTGLMILGVFPRFPKRVEPAPGAPADSYDAADTEAIHAVLVNLIRRHARDKSRPGWVVMVTSAEPHEGKTSFSAALSRAAASRGLSVAIKDCDFRRSSLRDFFPNVGRQLSGAAEDAGATALGFDEPALDEASGVSVLLAAPPADDAAKPHATLASPSFQQTLERLRARHDLVVIDTPPVLAVPDVLGIAGLADQVVMLVGWRQTARTAVLAALQMLRRAHAPLAGIVLSKVESTSFARSSGHNSHYARSYAGYD